MRSMRSPSAAIFFMTYFHRAAPPLDPLLQWDKAPPGADTFIDLSTLPQLARSARSTPMEITMHRPNIR